MSDLSGFESLFPELDALTSPAGVADVGSSNGVANGTSEGSAADAEPAPGADWGPGPGATYGGRRARARFERAMTLRSISGRESAPARVSLVAFDEEAVYIELSGGAVDGFAVRIVPELLEGHVQTPSFSIIYRVNGGRSPGRVEQALVAYMQARWFDTPFATLRAVIESDPGEPPPPDPDDADGDGGPGDGAPSAQDSPHVYHYGEGGPAAAFYAVNELERSRGFEFRGRVADVTHSELECRFGYPETGDGTVHFFAFPREEEQRSNGAEAGSATGAGRARTATALVSDLEDMDTIRTGVPRLVDLLANVDETHPETELVVLSASCTPRVTGDDMHDVAARVGEATGRRVVVPDHVVNPHLSVLLEELARGVPSRRRSDEASLALVGFPRLPGRAALEALLQHAGLQVVASLLPDIDPAELRLYGFSWMQVFFEAPEADRSLHTVYDALRAAYSAPALMPPAPLGMAGSRAFLMAIHDHLRRATGLRTRIPALLKHFEAPWERLVGEASRYRLGFVLDDTSLDQIERASLDTGIPVFAMAAELGFSFHCIVQGDRRARARVRQRLAKLVPPQRTLVTELEAGVELFEALRASPAAAFYSELSFEHRITRAGKSRFGPEDFAMGPEGALETGQRLLSAARTSFYRSYAEYLS